MTCEEIRSRYQEMYPDCTDIQVSQIYDEGVSEDVFVISLIEGKTIQSTITLYGSKK